MQFLWWTEFLWGRVLFLNEEQGVNSNLFHDSVPAWKAEENQGNVQAGIAYNLADIWKKNLPNAVLGVTCTVHHAI
jgi:hypothetical protein